MINFPDNPTVNQVFTAGSQTWVYDGAKWVAYGVAQGIYLPLTGGKLTGALNPAGGIIGVADGSDAAPGMVGEFMNSGQPALIGLTTVVPVSVVGFILSPGDWDVWGWGIFSSSNTTNALVAGLSTTINNIGTAYATAANSGSNSVRMTVPMIRISASASTSIWITVQANFTTGPVTGTGQMSARRVR